MKKLLVIILAITLVVSLSAVFVSAEGEVDPNGYEFDILAVDTTITAEKGLILTSEEALAASSTGWSVVIHCSKVGENVYVAKTAGITPTGTIQTFTFEEGDIVIAIHSSTSDLTKKSEFPNCEQKVAALAVTAGMYFELVGIDIETATATEGKAICTIEQPEITDESPDESTADETSSEDITSLAPFEDTSELESEVDSASSQDNDESVMTTDDDGLDTTTIILLCVAGVAILIVIGVVAAKKKK
ncbi:MAG: hypothetical protein A2Y15_00350 [Clostridiales bacterium GWF2_36_10]|nr:MAG: hypothetical protein A2Y15_00350 [Clostridiales bacterium GWF2_36_10]HAN21760.1 hypothetical protein [Clostridiales bacterium]